MHGHMNVEFKKERPFTSFSRTLVYAASILWVDEHTAGLQSSFLPAATGWHLTKIMRGRSAAACDMSV